MYIDNNNINKLNIGNIVQYNENVYSIYDIDEDLLYLNNSDLKNIGIPYNKVKPIIINDNVMTLCNMKLIGKPIKKYSNYKLITITSSYQLIKNVYNIDFKIDIINDYTNNDALLNITLDKLDNNESKLKYLHQIQNIFKHFFSIDLIVLN